MEDNHNHNQKQPNDGFNGRRDGSWQQDSGDKRKPQLNETVCGCECQHRNVIGEIELIENPPASRNAMDDVFLDADEGVDAHLLIELPAGMGTPDQIRVPTRHSEYEINQNGTLLVDLESVLSMADLRRMDSTDSMLNHTGSGEHSMVSSIIHSIRPESPAPVIYAIGAWSGPSFNNTARSGYFFHHAPLPLVAPIVCCSCRSSETDTESYGNSSVGSRMESTDLSEDDESMLSV